MFLFGRERDDENESKVTVKQYCFCKSTDFIVTSQNKKNNKI